MVNTSPALSSKELLRLRAAQLAAARAFFAERSVIEVDCPALTALGSLDAHIDLIPAIHAGRERRYLFSSPEYGMKRLLAAGSGDIYQLGHVFRDGELGQRHQPEFMMAEWYRVGMDFAELIEETLAFCRLFLEEPESETVTYQELFLRHVAIDPLSASSEALLQLCEPYDGWELEGRDALLNLILTQHIEPALGHGGFTVVTDYPASQAALACCDGDVAKRFEVYYRGIELANGYKELGDAEQQRTRFSEANELRRLLGKPEMPIDERFLDAITRLPACCGVAVGFDRLFMLQLGVQDIRDALPFAWELV